MSWGLPRFEIASASGPGIDDDEQHEGNALIIQWGPWLVIIELLRRASG